MLSISKEQIIKINESIGKAVARIKTIVEHLKEFSNEGTKANETMTQLGVNQLLFDVRDFYGSIVSKFDIKIFQKLNAEEIIIQGFKTPIEQILLNIIHNAIDAVNDKPINGEETEKIIQFMTYSEGDFGIIEINDNGNGIKPEILGQIFDPFFTTKEVGKGVGLGLSLVKTYIKDCQGEIVVKSVQNSTSFILKFKKANYER